MLEEIEGQGSTRVPWVAAVFLDAVLLFSDVSRTCRCCAGKRRQRRSNSSGDAGARVKLKRCDRRSFGSSRSWCLLPSDAECCVLVRREDSRAVFSIRSKWDNCLIDSRTLSERFAEYSVNSILLQVPVCECTDIVP